MKFFNTVNILAALFLPIVMSYSADQTIYVKNETNANFFGGIYVTNATGGIQKGVYDLDLKKDTLQPTECKQWIIKKPRSIREKATKYHTLIFSDNDHAAINKIRNNMSSKAVLSTVIKQFSGTKQLFYKIEKDSKDNIKIKKSEPFDCTQVEY